MTHLVTNQRIQRYLADHASRQALRVSAGLSANPVHDEAYELISWMASDGGALMLADEAAWELITSECRCFSEDTGPAITTWYQVPELRSHLINDVQDYIAAEVSQAALYLKRRGLALQHPSNSTLMRPADDAAALLANDTAFS